MLTPDTKTMLKRFAPIMLPSDRELWPLISDVTAVTNSGKDVPRATIVRPIIASLMPKNLAITVALSTSKRAPTAINTAPTAIIIISLTRPFLPSSATPFSAPVSTSVVHWQSTPSVQVSLALPFAITTLSDIYAAKVRSKIIPLILENCVPKYAIKE